MPSKSKLALVEQFIKENPAFERPVRIAEFQQHLVAQRRLMKSLFDGLSDARTNYQRTRNEFKTLLDQNGAWFDPSNAAMVEKMTERDSYQSLYEDTASAIILLAAASLERLHKAIGETLWTRGVPSYARSIKFSRAISLLRDQYMHLGEWRYAATHPSATRKTKRDAALEKKRESTLKLLVRLVKYPLASNAAAEFLERSAFADYSEFEAALASCLDGLVSGPLVPEGHTGIVQLAIKARGAARKSKSAR